MEDRVCRLARDRMSVSSVGHSLLELGALMSETDLPREFSNLRQIAEKASFHYPVSGYPIDARAIADTNFRNAISPRVVIQLLDRIAHLEDEVRTLTKYGRLNINPANF